MENLFWNGVWWGIVGTFAMTALMMIAKFTGMSPMPKPFPLAIIDQLVGEDKSKKLRMALAMMMHFGYGGLMGGVYAWVVEDFNIWNGLILGALLWLIMQVVFLPWVGWGLFGKNVTLKIAGASLMLHLVYGGVTAWMALGQTPY